MQSLIYQRQGKKEDLGEGMKNDAFEALFGIAAADHPTGPAFRRTDRDYKCHLLRDGRANECARVWARAAVWERAHTWAR